MDKAGKPVILLDQRPINLGINKSINESKFPSQVNSTSVSDAYPTENIIKYDLTFTLLEFNLNYRERICIKIFYY